MNYWRFAMIRDIHAGDVLADVHHYSSSSTRSQRQIRPQRTMPYAALDLATTDLETITEADVQRLIGPTAVCCFSTLATRPFLRRHAIWCSQQSRSYQAGWPIGPDDGSLPVLTSRRLRTIRSRRGRGGLSAWRGTAQRRHRRATRGCTSGRISKRATTASTAARRRSQPRAAGSSAAAVVPLAECSGSGDRCTSRLVRNRAGRRRYARYRRR